MPTVAIAQGALRGVQIGQVAHFRNIPFAQAQRFEPPQPAPGWTGERDASEHGPVCPQLVSPIAAVMGDPPEGPQDEACLSLSVATPLDRSRRRAVMVWFHGGAYAVGAGSFAWYRPDLLVSEGDVVVVNANYRIGAWGYLYMPGVSPGNLGLLDQLAVLRWVRDNIAAFGGDPSRVTVFGESAGAHSIAALMSARAGRGLFRRAIMQSAHLGLGFVSQRRALRVAQVLKRCANGADLRSLSSVELLAAQRRMLVAITGPGGFNTAPAFGPIAGLAPLPEPAHSDAVSAVIATDVDLLIGSTRDEMRAFFDRNPRIARLRSIPGWGAWAYQTLTKRITQRVFSGPAQRLADRQARADRASVYLYAFAWAPPTAPFGACHTIDLPFVWGGDAWRGSPMLGTTPWPVIEQLGQQVRRAWTAFARTGDPNTEGAPQWPRHRAGAAPGRRFA
jgi:para-nitrobenzyl esterase